MRYQPGINPNPDGQQPGQNYFEMAYDPTTVISTEKINEMVKVRLDLKEKVLRHAVVQELRRLGYTVIEPEDGDV